MTILDYLKNGSGIHIKKANRGKFTDYCGGKVTSECIARGKNSPSATIRKRATFAANARTWKHLTGGRVYFNTKEDDKEGLLIIDPRKENSNTQEQHKSSESSSSLNDNWINEMYTSLGSTQVTAPQVTAPQVTAQQTTSSGTGPRGYRNNNPLNIRISDNAWQGKVSLNTDGSFELFIDMAHGYRAGFVNMRSQINKGYDTLRKLIGRWAPASDGNNPEHYAQTVASTADISVDDIINPNDPNLMQKIAAAMAKVENGQDANLDDIAQGWKLYMGSTL